MPLNTNNRIFWAVQAFGLARDGSSSFTPVHGLQSIGVNTTFNLEQVYEIGQIAIYENIEDLPDIEVTAEKVIDGYPLLYHLATPNATSATLSGRSGVSCIGALSIFMETQDSASGTPNSQVTMSGLYISSLSYTLPIDGNCTESVTLVGNNKVWTTGTGFTFTGSLFNNADQPLALTSGTGGVQRRENVKFGSSTLLPSNIPGISSSGTNDARSDGRGRKAHVQRIAVSTDLGREPLLELGTRNPFFRYASFPVEVTTEIEILGVDGDLIGATEAGVAGNGNNLSAHQITIELDDSTKINTGSNNKLSGVNYGGADAGGGNASITFTYTTFNEMKVTHNQDPAGLT